MHRTKKRQFRVSDSREERVTRFATPPPCEAPFANIIPISRVGFPTSGGVGSLDVLDDSCVHGLLKPIARIAVENIVVLRALTVATWSFAVTIRLR